MGSLYYYAERHFRSKAYYLGSQFSDSELA